MTAWRDQRHETAQHAGCRIPVYHRKMSTLKNSAREIQVSRLIRMLFLCAAVTPTGTPAAEHAVCHEAGNFRIVVKATGSVGHDFIVKKIRPDQVTSPCNFHIEPEDMEIRNENAEHFLALEGSLLILDSGTAPGPRGLILWDIEKGIKVYSGSYSGPYRIERNGMYFWLHSGDATDANCAQAVRWREQGLGAAIETEVWLGFADYRLVQGTAKRCVARQ